MTDLPEEDIRHIEIGELGKIVERGRENVEQVEEKQNHGAPPQQYHLLSNSVHNTTAETDVAFSANEKKHWSRVRDNFQTGKSLFSPALQHVRNWVCDVNTEQKRKQTLTCQH